ncbi:PLAC8 family-domain-containing protein, partial [Endogone sp. FLAS-F59071]
MSQQYQQGYQAQAPMNSKQMMSVSDPNVPVGKWRHGLCDCFGDCGLCIQTCCCPCITYGQNKDKMLGDGSCFAHGAVFCLLVALTGSIGSCILGFMNRGEVRARYGIQGDGCSDCMTHCCCSCCALIQEGREINDHRAGLDVSFPMYDSRHFQY